jgi:hypothetical protein
MCAPIKSLAAASLALALPETTDAAAAMASRATAQNRYRSALSLEPEMLQAMKKFLRDRQPVDIKSM